MELKFSKINGTNVYLDYDLLKKSIFEKLKNTCREAEVIVLNNFPVAVSPQANIDFIILLKIPIIPNSYSRIIVDDGWLNVTNQIIQILKRLDVPCYFMKMTGSGNTYHPAPTPVNRWLVGINKVVLNPYDLDKLK